EEHVVLALQGDEARTRNQCRQLPALLKRHAGIVARMEHQGRHPDRLGDLGDVDVIGGLDNRGCILGRGRNPLELIKPLMLLLRAAGNELRGEELPKGGIVPPPPGADELEKLSASSRSSGGAFRRSRPWAKAPRRIR